MKTLLYSIVFLLSIPAIAGKITFKISSLPDNHSFSEPIYFAGNLNSWNPGDENFQLTYNGDETYSIQLEGTGNVQFKFTRGNWDKVEKGNNCAEIANRTFTFGTDTLKEFAIINWADDCSSGNTGAGTASKNVSIMNKSFYMPQFDKERRIWIYLPANYETSSLKYPVIYMHDGQNLFDTQTSFSGEWQIDESLDKMIANGAQASIIVGIDNGGSSRIAEYTPWTNSQYGGGEGDKYVDFLVSTLKPYIDSTYRTLSDRENTGILGSSLGGLISYYAGLKHQEIFSKVGIFSPSFWFSDSSLIFAQETKKIYPMQLYFVAGGQEGSGGEVISACENVMELLKGSGFTQEEMFLNSKADGAHSEWFWRREFPSCYQWFWGIETLKNSFPQVQFEVFPNPAKDSVHLQLNNLNEPFDVVIINMQGERVWKATNKNSNVKIDVQALPSGLYIIQCEGENFKLSRKLNVVR